MKITFWIIFTLLLTCSFFSGWFLYEKINEAKKSKIEQAYRQGQIDYQKGIIKYKMKLDTTLQEVKN